MRAQIIQLQQEVERLHRRIAELEDGECRFNCRTKSAMWKEGFKANALLPIAIDESVLNEAYKNWREQHERRSGD